MKKVKRALMAVVIMGLLAPLFAAEAPNLKLAVRVFMIPKEQNIEALLPDGRGGTVAFQGYGDVTANFPHATVIFRTELALNASGDAIGQAIMERIFFGNGGIAIRKVEIRELKSLILELGKDHPQAEARFEESRGEGLTSDYEVQAAWISVGKNEALIRLRFFAGWSSQAGRLGTGISDCVVSMPIEVPESKLILIGAPSFGKVFWLAVGAMPN